MDGLRSLGAEYGRREAQALLASGTRIPPPYARVPFARGIFDAVWGAWPMANGGEALATDRSLAFGLFCQGFQEALVQRHEQGSASKH
ncbi:MAG TPA: hypothetical protein VND24_06480 [Steroidobacteraceae bacterium]|nr:hypothetical protein [Steroidobacteraceae bacterium]